MSLFERPTILLILLATLVPLALPMQHDSSRMEPVGFLTVHAAQDEVPGTKSFVIVVSKKGFNGTHSSNLALAVNEGDRVQITFINDSDDRHIIEITGYEVRAEITLSRPESTVVFLADKLGTFTIKCSSETRECRGHDRVQDGRLEVKATGVRPPRMDKTEIEEKPPIRPPKPLKTELKLDVIERCFPRCPLTLIGTLTDSKGKPIVGMPITFSVNTTFGTLKLGLPYTDSKGMASVNYSIPIGRTLELVASFPGGGGYEASASHAVRQLSTVKAATPPEFLASFAAGGGSTYLVGELLAAALPLLTVRNVAAGMAVTVVLSVWGTYIYVLRQIRGIVKEGESGKNTRYASQLGKESRL